MQGVNRFQVARLCQCNCTRPCRNNHIRVARALFALTGGDAAWIKHFMRSQNTLTGGVPAEQVQTIQGLIRVLTCLDALRGKV
ncbi:MbcA/ParS/Xre antitoxin family protein [Nitrincola alkalisediminis]|uniref:MbcA/ParS/Xre antitoxin family protein n=1 Tax=Nitrincola alkalisediminis TaxID=1366656 RepID=UPI0024838BA3|nr:MbcA/ParS/Xre antitoxin family protein [Nitrincola alkalisediminis]